MTERPHSHYFKSVEHLTLIDVYRILELFEVTNPCLAHAAKKILVAGGRGAKDISQDIQEAIDTLERWKAMRAEDHHFPQSEYFTDKVKIAFSQWDGWSCAVGSKRAYHVQTLVLCPFHHEKTPSCLVQGWSHNDEPQATSGIWKCLSCGESGTWVQATQHETVGKTGQLVPDLMILTISDEGVEKCSA